MDSSRIAVVVGHPRTGTYCEALALRYAEGARAAGKQVDVFVTGSMKFDPVLWSGFGAVQPLEPDLLAAHDALLAADHIVFVFPLWFGGMPAQFKGFIERVFQPEVVEMMRRKKLVKLLAGKSVRIVVTMGMPVVVYRWIFRAHGIKVLKRNILGMIGAAPVRVTIIGRVEAMSDRGRKRWLRRMERMGRRAE